MIRRRCAAQVPSSELDSAEKRRAYLESLRTQIEEKKAREARAREEARSRERRLVDEAAAFSPWGQSEPLRRHTSGSRACLLVACFLDRRRPGSLSRCRLGRAHGSVTANDDSSTIFVCGVVPPAPQGGRAPARR